jgi:hypothetical protein
MPTWIAGWNLASSLCLHSRAAEFTHGGSDGQLMISFAEDDLYTAVDREIVMEFADNVFIINPTHGRDFLLWFAASEANHPRYFVRASSNNIQMLFLQSILM